MKLEKVKNRNSGYDIYLTIGGDEHSSYWSAPPTSIDHVDINYLKNRYPKINTILKMETFKELYKNLWIDITEEQLRQMKHSLGLDYEKKPYRNYSFLNHKDKEWNDLVVKGLAAKSRKEPNEWGSIYFWLTKQGVEYIVEKSISDKAYKKL